MKKSYARKGKRWFALFLCLCLIGTTTPVTARAENGGTAVGLCEHHPEHTEECGYVAPTEGYECEHVHDEVCGYSEGHECGHVHDENCGYVESSEGSPCTYVCEICGQEEAKELTETETATEGSTEETDNTAKRTEKAQALIDALPAAEDITAENYDDIAARLDEIDAAREELTDEENEQIDYTKYDAAISKMMELMGQPDAGEPTLMSLDGFSATGRPKDATVKTINLNAAVLRPTVVENGNKVWNTTEGNLVYFGTYGGDPVKYRVLASPNTQENSLDYLLLDCDTVLWKGSDSIFDSSSNNWNDSYLKRFLNSEKGTDYDYSSNGFLTGNFTDLEKNAIANTTLKQQDIYQSLHQRYQDNEATNQVFCLSAAEAEALYQNDDARKKEGDSSDNRWWLRSAYPYEDPYNGYWFAGSVNHNGEGVTNNIATTIVGVSPALNVNLSSVLFASVSGADKSSALALVSVSTAKEWKLTLLDSGKTVKVTAGQNVTGQDADGSTTITVPYTYTGSDVSQISVMITDKAYTESDALVLYYGALQGVAISNTTGTGTFTLPSGLSDDCKIYIIAEDVNGDKETDYASKPVEITTQGESVPKAKLLGITAPPDITGVANGTAKTADALGLPKTVTIATEDTEVTSADVTWDLDNLASGAYDPSVPTEQTFTVSGTVSLPKEVENSDNISLETTIQVTVSAADVAGVPTADLAGGTYTSEQYITLSSSTAGAEIYYTTDGSAPSSINGTKYTDPISVTGTAGQSKETTIKAIAIKSGMRDSDVASFTYIINLSALKYSVTVNNGNGDGEYAQGETVTITADTATSGKQFKEWTVESGGVSLASKTSSTTTFTMPANAVEVTAVYEDSSGQNKPSKPSNPDEPSNQDNNSSMPNNNDAEQKLSKDHEPKTGDHTQIELYATLAMIAGLNYLLLYFTDHGHGMTEETKKELVARLVGWAKRGGRIRKYLALAAIFILLVYYHSIGKKTCAEWKEIYGE